MKTIKHLLKAVGIVLGIVVLILVLAVAYLTLREYRPDAVEEISPAGGIQTLKSGDTFSVTTFNTGYAGLDASEDFFMDGGTRVQPDSAEEIQENLTGISGILKETRSDVYFLQEVDRDSKRSYHIDEAAYYEKALGMTGMFAHNFKCDFVPYPLPPIGKVESGLVSLTALAVGRASRISLPESFSWPVKTCNLKRCMLEMRIPLEGTDAELVLINFHLEAYDNGEGRTAQSNLLKEKLQSEYEAGNYVLAGGDFNQTFDDILDKYPLLQTESWAPQVLSKDSLPEHFAYAIDDTYPTCRLLNAPYTGSYEDSQVYVLDGFIISDNLELQEVRVIDRGFQYSDHQPVKITVKLN